MTNRVGYEWDIETVTSDEEAEILDHWHADELHQYPEKVLAAALDKTNNGATFFRLVLVRTEENGYRSWAYVDQFHMLPITFYLADESQHVRVPKRFHSELKRYATDFKQER